MRTMLLGLTLATVALPVSAHAQTSAAPGVVTGGADGTYINGKPAARTGDRTSGCPK
jgi:uncharacterized Zn-binding protein involved in type VI secretion